jgi:hypothetical protein
MELDQKPMEANQSRISFAAPKAADVSRNGSRVGGLGEGMGSAKRPSRIKENISFEDRDMAISAAKSQ